MRLAGELRDHCVAVRRGKLVATGCRSRRKVHQVRNGNGELAKHRGIAGAAHEDGIGRRVDRVMADDAAKVPLERDKIARVGRSIQSKRGRNHEDGP